MVVVATFFLYHLYNDLLYPNMLPFFSSMENDAFIWSNGKFLEVPSGH